MTIDATNNNPRIRYSVSEGVSQTNFTVPFEFFDDSDLYVYVDGIIKTITTDYTVTGGDGSTGDISFVSPVVGATGGSIVVITRNIPIERVTDFVTGVDISRAALNTQLDTLTALIADVNDTGSRSLRLADTDAPASLTIPNAADRANGFLSFDSNGDVAVNAIVNLDFLDLERLDIDNLRLDGNTLSSLAGNITLDSLGDITLDHASLGSIYFSRAGTPFGEIYGRGASSELRLYGDDSGTLITLTAEHVSASSTIARLKTDNAALYLDTDSGGLIYLQANSDVIKLDVATANNLKISTNASNEVFILNNSGLTIDGSITSTYGYFTNIYSSSLRTSVGVDWLSRGADYVQFKSGASSSDYAQLNFDDVASDIIKLKSFNGNDLHLDAENVVSLLYNGGVKLSTKTDGVTVTGDVGATTGTFTGDVSAVNATLTGYLRGPSSFTIDPAAHGDNTGTVVIAGNLQVDGTTTTINSTTLAVDDANIVVASGAANAAAADGAGLTIDGADITFTYDDSDGRMELNKELFVYGNSTNGDASFVSISNSDTGGDDIRIQGTNPTYTNYDTTIPESGVSEYIGGHNFLGRLTSSSYHTYSAIRPYIVEGLDSNTTGKKGGLHFGVSDGSSSAVTNIILKVEPDGIDVTGNITVSGTVDGRDLATDGTKLDGIEASADVTDATNVQAAGALMDSELTDITAVKAINQGLATTDDVTFNDVDVDGDLTIGSSTFTWDADTGQDGQLQLDRELFVYGNVTNGTAAYVQIGSSDTGGDDIRIQGTNPNFTLYDTTVPTSGVSTYIGGWYNYGRLTSSSYIAYSAIRPYIVEGLDNDSTGKKGGLHFGVRDGTSSALTNIIMKVEPDGVDVTGTVTADGLTVGSSTLTESASDLIIDATDDLFLRANGQDAIRIFQDAGSLQNVGFRNAAQDGSTFLVSGDGDISFYDTSGNAKFFWDASAERLGIGTSSPSTKMHLVDSDPKIQLTRTSDFYYGQLSADGFSAFTNTNGNAPVIFKTATTERMRIDSSGNVGIGTSSPTSGYLSTAALDVSGPVVARGALSSNQTNAGVLQYYSNETAIRSYGATAGSGQITFSTGGGGSADTERMRIDSSGNVGIGISNPASYDWSNTIDLVVGDTSGSSGLSIVSSTSGGGNIAFADGTTGDERYRGYIYYDHTSDYMSYWTAGTERMRISSLGRVGIGTSDPQGNLQIYSSSSPVLKLTGGSTGTPQIHFGDLDSDIGMIEYKNSNDSMVFTTAGSGRLTIDSSGNVGIGLTPSYKLDVKDGSSRFAFSEANGNARITLDGVNGDFVGSDYSMIESDGSANLRFYTSATERMRIDSSGNLLVGHTAEGTWSSNNSAILRGSGVATFTSTSTPPLYANRLTTDGDIIEFRKGGSTVGSIGSNSSSIYALSGDTGILLYDFADEILPVGTLGSTRDAAISLGRSTTRFKDLYLSGGVVFGSTGGSVTSKTLDDYEEGTWTPTFSASTMGTSLTSSNTTYVKVGKVVTVKGIITFSGTSGNVVVADYFQIGGLPFTHEGNGHGIWWQSTSYATGVRNSGHCMTAGQTIYGGCEYAGGVSRGTGLNFAITYEVD